MPEKGPKSMKKDDTDDDMMRKKRRNLNRNGYTGEVNRMFCDIKMKG